MATARPFAYNPGATGPIPGTEQVGSLAVGTPANGFAATGLQWWNGPDEDLGYVIAQSVPSNTQPTPVSGVSASVGFFRSSALTDPSFISIANAVAGPSGGGPFASGSAAKTWLNDNGYWTSYVGATGSTGATGGGYILITTPYNPPAAGKTIFPNFGAGGATAGILNPNTFATGAVYWNPIDANNVDQTSYYNDMLTRSVTASFTQNGNTAIYSGVTGAFTFIPGATGVSGSFAYNPQANPGKLTLTQASPVNFTLGGTVYISYT
jgi:hypothetical protein